MKDVKKFVLGDSVWVYRDGYLSKWRITSAFGRSGVSGAMKSETVSYWAYRVGAEKGLDSSEGSLNLTEVFATKELAAINRCQQISKLIEQQEAELLALKRSLEETE